MARDDTQPTTLRNVGICAHIDAGKTTLTERILHLTGRERHIGRVDDGTSVMDWMSEERERGITIAAAATRVEWNGADINLVDTPGHVDFTVEVERCMRILDGAVLVLDGTKGVEPQTETVWRQVAQRGLPAIAFANKCERPGADVLGCAEAIADRLGARAAVVAYPLGGGDSEKPFIGVVDIVARVAWGVAANGQRDPLDIPESVADEVDVLRAELIELLGDLDESMFEIICEGRQPTAEQILRSLRTAVRARELVPVFCGAALLGHGVPLLLDAVAALLPPPTGACRPDVFDRRTGEIYRGELPTPLLLAFKVHSKLVRGERSDLTFVRLYRGEVAAGTRLWNDRTKVYEEVQSVLRIHASEVEHIERATDGDIVALAGLHATGAGDTLSTEDGAVRLEPPRVPAPVVGVLLEPIRDDERVVLREALEQIAREDPSLCVSEDTASGQWLLEGMGELHLDIALVRLKGEFRVEPRSGPPRVAYRESIRAASAGSATVDRAFGDVTAHVEVDVALDPLGDMGGAVEFELELAGAEGPPSFDAGAWSAVRAALRAESSSGPLAGHPLSGARVRVTAVRSETMGAPGVAWAQAAVAALRDALKRVAVAKEVRLMEPWMTFVVDVPVDVSSGVIGDLNSRHATMDEIISTGTEGRRVTGTAPLRTLLGYSTALRSQSKGRGTFSLAPAGLRESVGE